MRAAHPPLRWDRERGVTLLMTLVVIIGLLGLGITGVWIASMSTNVSGNLVARQAASNAAYAGVQHGRLVLQAAANTPGFCPGDPAHPWSCTLSGHHASDHIPSSSAPALPTSDGAILWDGSTPMVAINSPSGGGQVLGSYTVRVRNDPLDVAAGSYVADSNDSVIIRAEGRDPSGTALVVVEAAVTQQSAGGTGGTVNSIFGKNIDPYGSNSLTGSFHF